MTELDKQIEHIKLQRTTKPEGPSTQFTVFKCNCGHHNRVTECFGEQSDLGDGDSLDFTCECGKYYKKVSRIPDEAITDSWYIEGWE